MSYTEEDASELTKEIMTLFDGLIIADESGTILDRFDSGILTRKEYNNKILQLIRKKLKLTRTYKTLYSVNSEVHNGIDIQEEHFVESHNNPHKGIRLIFGDIQSEQEEFYNIKLFTAEDIRVLQSAFTDFMKSCKHETRKDWKKVDMGLDESGEIRWYHYICLCGILQKVEKKYI